MIPIARRTPSRCIVASVSARYGCQLRMPRYTGSAGSVWRSCASQRGRLAQRQLGERRAPADQLVVMHHRLDPLRRRRPPAQDVVEKRPHVLHALGAAEGDQQDGVVCGHTKITNTDGHRAPQVDTDGTQMNTKPQRTRRAAATSRSRRGGGVRVHWRGKAGGFVFTRGSSSPRSSRARHRPARRRDRRASAAGCRGRG